MELSMQLPSNDKIVRSITVRDLRDFNTKCLNNTS